MSMPKRIQRRRTKGWRMPDGAVYVGRPTKWGNPFKVGGFFKIGDPDPRYRGAFRMAWCESFGASSGFTCITTNEMAVEFFRRLICATKKDYSELRGKDLACWCPLSKPCHADILLEIANK